MSLSGNRRRKGIGTGGLEYLSLDGLRLDGRKCNEVRKIRCSFGALSRADGSAYYEQGNTRVLAAVYGPREPTSRARLLHDRAVVFAEFSVAAFASSARRRSRKSDRRSTDAAAAIKAIFEGVILVKNIPRTQIDIYIQVLQNDGGVLVAAINAASLALVNAGVPMCDIVVACSVGYVDQQYMLDLNSTETGASGPELLMAVLGHSGKVASFQLESRVPNTDVLERALEYGAAGCQQIFHVLAFELKNQSLRLLDSRGTIAF